MVTALFILKSKVFLKQGLPFNPLWSFLGQKRTEVICKFTKFLVINSFQLLVSSAEVLHRSGIVYGVTAT